MIAWVLALVALGADPVCASKLTPVDDALSVSWISPLGQRVGGRGRVPLHVTRDLREWLAARPGATVGDLLRHTGRRKRPGDPRRTWKVTVFEVRSTALCRPLALAEPGEVVDGLAVCDGGPRPGSGCGYVSNRKTGERGPDVYVSRWRDLAQRGFCVLTADRFVAEGAAP